MKIAIDPFAGYCFGVKRAIEIAETELKQSQNLYCLGNLVHNDEEITRLESAGMRTIGHDLLSDISGSKILIRAHGEPPSTFRNAAESDLEIVDATCPIVKKFQQRIKSAWMEMKAINGKVIIFGKPDHPEVIGLNGQTDNNAIVVENLGDLKNVDFGKPIRLFAQTTKSRKEYQQLIDFIEQKINESNTAYPDFKHYNTICGQVANRIPKLKEFCRNHDVIIFVSGSKSSNGRQLFEICKAENDRSYFISNSNELIKEWVLNTLTVGISGATSTPFWLINQIAEKISNF